MALERNVLLSSFKAIGKANFLQIEFTFRGFMKYQIGIVYLCVNNSHLDLGHVC
jgi:hypothetical protein